MELRITFGYLIVRFRADVGRRGFLVDADSTYNGGWLCLTTYSTFFLIVLYVHIYNHWTSHSRRAQAAGGHGDTDTTWGLAA
jgi:hypothetical protein